MGQTCINCLEIFLNLNAVFTNYWFSFSKSKRIVKKCCFKNVLSGKVWQIQIWKIFFFSFCKNFFSFFFLNLLIFLLFSSHFRHFYLTFNLLFTNLESGLKSYVQLKFFFWKQRYGENAKKPGILLICRYFCHVCKSGFFSKEKFLYTSKYSLYKMVW